VFVGIHLDKLARPNNAQLPGHGSGYPLKRRDVRAPARKKKSPGGH
jgi:hypothetical protein